MTTSVDSRPSFDVRSPAATAAGWTGERGLPAALDPRGPRRCRPHRPARQPSSRCAPRRLFGAVRARGAEGRAFAWGERGSGRVSSWRFLDIGLGRHLGRRSRAKAPPGFPLRHAYSNGDILDAVKLLPKRLYPLETASVLRLLVDGLPGLTMERLEEFMARGLRGVDAKAHGYDITRTRGPVAERVYYWHLFEDYNPRELSQIIDSACRRSSRCPRSRPTVMAYFAPSASM